MASATAKARLESISRHLGETAESPGFELEDHPIDSVRSLRVRLVIPNDDLIETHL
jgi:hypothetical protein